MAEQAITNEVELIFQAVRCDEVAEQLAKHKGFISRELISIAVEAGSEANFAKRCDHAEQAYRTQYGGENQAKPKLPMAWSNPKSVIRRAFRYGLDIEESATNGQGHLSESALRKAVTKESTRQKEQQRKANGGDEYQGEAEPVPKQDDSSKDIPSHAEGGPKYDQTGEAFDALAEALYNAQLQGVPDNELADLVAKTTEAVNELTQGYKLANQVEQGATISADAQENERELVEYATKANGDWLFNSRKAAQGFMSKHGYIEGQNSTLVEFEDGSFAIQLIEQQSASSAAS